MAEPTPIKDVIKEKEVDSLESKPKGRGGPRPNSGRPKGRLDQKTLDQLAVKRKAEQRILNWMDRLLNAQMQKAIGEQALFVKIKERDSKGKVIHVTHERVTDEDTIIAYLDWENADGDSPHDEDHYYYLAVKPADNQALDSLINRGIGKSPDKLEVTGGFFNQNKLVVEVVGERQNPDEVENDGETVVSPAGESDTPTDGEAGTEPAAEPEAGPSTPTP
jgi:hypothetical protein